MLFRLWKNELLMIIETILKEYVFSKVPVYPKNIKAQLAGKYFVCKTSGIKKVNELEIKINPIYIIEIFETKQKFEIFEGSITYSLLTDGKLSGEQLYEVFKNAMTMLITMLNNIEKHNSVPETKDVPILSLESLLPQVKRYTDAFDAPLN
jgi:hypothetical protein